MLDMASSIHSLCCWSSSQVSPVEGPSPPQSPHSPHSTACVHHVAPLTTAAASSFTTHSSSSPSTPITPSSTATTGAMRTWPKQSTAKRLSLQKYYYARTTMASTRTSSSSSSSSSPAPAPAPTPAPSTLTPGQPGTQSPPLLLMSLASPSCTSSFPSTLSLSSQLPSSSSPKSSSPPSSPFTATMPQSNPASFYCSPKTSPAILPTRQDNSPLDMELDMNLPAPAPALAPSPLPAKKRFALAIDTSVGGSTLGPARQPLRRESLSINTSSTALQRPSGLARSQTTVAVNKASTPSRKPSLGLFVNTNVGLARQTSPLPPAPAPPVPAPPSEAKGTGLWLTVPTQTNTSTHHNGSLSPAMSMASNPSLEFLPSSASSCSGDHASWHRTCTTEDESEDHGSNEKGFYNQRMIHRDQLFPLSKDAQHYYRQDSDDCILDTFPAHVTISEEEDDSSEEEQDDGEQEISCILPGALYLGPEIVHGAQVVELEQLGVKRVLNMATECEDRLIEAHPWMEYHKIGVHDHVDADVAAGLVEAVKVIAGKGDSRDGAVYVHCKAGKSRSVTATIAFLMMEKQWSLKQAYEHVLARRPCMCPNIGFVTELIAMEKRCRGDEATGMPIQRPRCLLGL